MGSLDLLEEFDSHAGLRNALREIATIQDHWAGIPMPLNGERLVIEPKYPNAEALMAMGGDRPEDEPKPEDGPALRIRNTFWSKRHRCYVHVCEKDGKAVVAPSIGSGNSVSKLITTIACADAWGFEQESKATHLLGTLLRHRQFKHYMLTGTFLETSKRSGTHYLFRRLRPTLAITSKKGRYLSILCAMCMHPIGYYDGSWAGAMCQTDDVIAHLMLMRADEPMFWRRCNQHAGSRPEAAV